MYFVFCLKQNFTFAHVLICQHLAVFDILSRIISPLNYLSDLFELNDGCYERICLYIILYIHCITPVVSAGLKFDF